MASNDTNFLADLLPSAVIKVITIETLGGMLDLETNPHIVEETVPVYKRAALQNSLGSKAGAEFEAMLRASGHDLGLRSTAAQLANYATAMGSASSSNKETTMVTLDVAIKDTLNQNDSAGQWFMSGDITKYLYVLAAQFSSKTAVNAYKSMLLKASGRGIQAVHNYLAGHMTADDLKKSASDYGIPGVGNLIKSRENIKFTYISVQDIINEIDSSTTGQAVSEQDLMLAGFTSIDTNGNTIYEFPATLKFEHKSASPSYLSYYVCPFINIEQLLLDNNLTRTSADMNAAQYSTNGEWVTAISNGQLNRGDGRISDFRDVDEVVPAHSVDLSIINLADRFASNSGKNFTTLPAYQHKYFSDVHLSTSAARDCTFVFAFGQLDFMKDNSVYGRLFDNVEDSIADEVLKKCTIEEIKIIRRRVKRHKQGSYARGYPNVYEPWDNTQVDHVVVSSKSGRQGKLLASERVIRIADGSTGKDRTKLMSGGIREQVIETNATNGRDFRIRHFTGKDAEVKTCTTGIYQYGVEITMRDYVPVYMAERLSVLIDYIAMLKEYEVYANIPVVNRYQQTYANPHVDDDREDQMTKKADPLVDLIGGESVYNPASSPTATKVGYYDPKLNKFTNEFATFAERKYARTQPWIRAPRAWIDLVDLIVNEKTTAEEKERFVEIFTSACNPRSGTPRGIAAVIGVFDKYVKIVQDLISAEPPTTNSAAAANPSTPSGGSGVTNRTVTYKCYFHNDAFDSDLPPATGVTFLDVTAGDTAALPMVSTSAYKKRAETEVTKYFAFEPPNAAAAYKCLSAQTINLLEAGNTIDLKTIVLGDTVADMSQQLTDFGKVIQYMGSVRKAGQTRVLTVDSKNRVGQAIAPEFGFSLMSAEEYDRVVKGETVSSPGAIPASAISLDADQGSSADVGAGALLSTSAIPLLTVEEEEVDYLNVFPSAMPTADWLNDNVDEMVDVMMNLHAGFETVDQTFLSVATFVNSSRDLLHSTPLHPARPGEANYSPLAIIIWVLDQVVASGETDLEAGTAMATEIVGNLPIPIQAAAKSVGSADEVRSHIKDKLTESYWNDPLYNILYQLHFMMNARVEYLVGYRESNLTPRYGRSVGAEVWAPLTKTTVDLLHAAEGRQLLCRLRPYNYEALRIAFPKALKMPIWNSKFMLVGNNDKPLSGLKRRMGITRPSTQNVKKGLY